MLRSTTQAWCDHSHKRVFLQLTQIHIHCGLYVCTVRVVYRASFYVYRKNGTVQLMGVSGYVFVNSVARSRRWPTNEKTTETKRNSSAQAQKECKRFRSKVFQKKRLMEQWPTTEATEALCRISHGFGLAMYRQCTAHKKSGSIPSEASWPHRFSKNSMFFVARIFEETFIP